MVVVVGNVRCGLVAIDLQLSGHFLLVLLIPATCEFEQHFIIDVGAHVGSHRHVNVPTNELVYYLDIRIFALKFNFLFVEVDLQLFHFPIYVPVNHCVVGP